MVCGYARVSTKIQEKNGNEQLEHALQLLKTYSYSQVSKMTGISVSTIYRAKLKLE